MNVRFNPPQLQAARQSPTLLRVLSELMPAEPAAEVRVLQSFPHEPMRLVYITSGQPPASIDVPRDWLYREITEQDVREQVNGLLKTPKRARC